MPILDDIIARKKQEIASLPAIKAERTRRAPFIDSLLKKRTALIAEVKLRSPSDGDLLERSRVPDLLRKYERHAQAVSVLCDSVYFGGGYNLLKDISSLTTLPLLAKEFILDAVQIDHAAAHGASAVLLIARILGEQDITALATHAISLGLDVLLELHEEHEVEKAAAAFLALGVQERRHVLIGINNRNLDILTVNLQTTVSLVPRVRATLPGIRCIIAESGIRIPNDVHRLSPLVNGFLVGSSLIRQKSGTALLSYFSSVS